MVKHIIIWKIKEEKAAEKESIKAAAKKNLEDLMGQIDGLTSMIIHTEGLKSSNGDLMLDASFTDEKAMNAYTVNPKHVAVADTFVRPFMEIRLCFDYEV